MSSTLLGWLVGLAATYVLSGTLLLHWTQGAHEPPAVAVGGGSTFSPLLPFLGPVVAMARHRAWFHTRVRDKLLGTLNKNVPPIYTLRLLGARLYVVNSPRLVPAVQKLHKTLSFAAVAAASARIFLVSKQGREVIARGLMQDGSYTANFGAAIHPALAPGAHLNHMNRAAARSIAASLDARQAWGPQETNLFDWVRDQIVLATSDAVYGPHNPFRDPEVLQSWYEFEPQIMTFAIGLFPRLLARKAFKARQRLKDAFIKYMRAGQHEQGSALIQARYRHSSSFGVRLEDIAGAEVGGAFGVLGSTAPACFWVVYHLFSDTVVLQECRAEVSALVQHDQQGVSSIDVTSIKSKCPILLSTLQEVLRFRHISVSARVVLQDEKLLDGKYHLKKGGMLMIPVTVMHSDPESWGQTASVFDHRRFLNKDTPPAKGGPAKPIPRTAYRPFGGGHVLCPGRHFATTEILAFAALAILRFDITPVAGGKWKDPTIERSSLVSALPTPDDPVRVEISPREQSRAWRVELVESDYAVAIASEDVGG